MCEQNKDTPQINQFDEKSSSIEMYFNAVFNNINDPIFVKDEESKFVLINDAFCKFLGLPKSEIIGKTLTEKLSPNELESCLSIDKQVLKQGVQILCEELLSPKGLRTKVITIRKNRFVDSNGNYFIIGVIQDITETRQFEQDKRDAEKEKNKRALELSIISQECLAQSEENEYLRRQLKRASSAFYLR
ncbi:MAG: PAS domain S-box-containing protein [Glaciecola sp.]|jgi:PAS domain S-box-containing protein